MLLSLLVDRLADDVPAEDGVPSEEQYERAVQDAVRDFSERCGLEQIASLNIVPGTATYDLPEDYLKMISLESFASADGVIISAQGLIPISATWQERHTIRNGQITFRPTPTFTMAREFSYKAAWVSTVLEDDYAPDEDFETMGEREARIVLLKAKSIAMNKLSNAQAGSAIKYSFGAVSEDLTGGAESTRKTADLMETEYLDACNKYNGSVGFLG